MEQFRVVVDVPQSLGRIIVGIGDFHHVRVAPSRELDVDELSAPADPPDGQIEALEAVSGRECPGRMIVDVEIDEVPLADLQAAHGAVDGREVNRRGGIAPALYGVEHGNVLEHVGIGFEDDALTGPKGDPCLRLEPAQVLRARRSRLGRRARDGGKDEVRLVGHPSAAGGDVVGHAVAVSEAVAETHAEGGGRYVVVLHQDLAGGVANGLPSRRLTGARAATGASPAPRARSARAA